ncbi:SRPBCC domain-containing protein [Luteococcus sp. H138]|uniref:SRPBCC domain-containing protein n=1 Tax=unclassified Luteococcus TaxID=2639923 RepID=UPI00313B3A91
MTELWGELNRSTGSGTVTLRHCFPADQARLWQAITDPAELGRWMAAVTITGDDYRIDFDPSDPAQQTSGPIEHCDPPTGFTLAWLNAGEDEASRVTLTLAEGADGTELTLVHSLLPTSQDVGHAAGWEVYLRCLEAHLAGAELPDWGTSWEVFREAHAARQ